MSRFKMHGREAEVAVQAALQAAELCERVRIEMAANTLEKADRSPVTVADFGSQALICRAVHEAFPDDAIVAEESAAELRNASNRTLLDRLTGYVAEIRPGATGARIMEWIDFGTSEEGSERFWTLDPIDGTKGFLRDDQYAVALALIVDGTIRVGVLICPQLKALGSDHPGTLFVAVAGEGAYEASIASPDRFEPIRVSSTTNPADLRFCESVESAHSSHSDAARVADVLGIRAEPIRMDSQAKYGVVARGDAEIYMRIPRAGVHYEEKIWDHAAGAVVVTEAGGVVTDLQGKALDFSRGRTLAMNRGVLVTNGPLHEQVLAALSDGVVNR